MLSFKEEKLQKTNIHNILLKKTVKPIDFESKNRKNFDKIADLYLNSPENSKFSLAQTLENIYSKKFIGLLENILGDPNAFNKSNVKIREKIQENIDSLFFIEDHFKHYQKKSEHRPEILNLLLTDFFLKFERSYTYCIKLKSPKKNVNRKFLFSKIYSFFSSFVKYLQKSNKILFLDGEDTLISPNLLKSIINNITAQELFLIVCSCALQHAYKHLLDTKVPLFEYAPDTFKTDFNHRNNHLKVYEHELVNSFEKRFMIFIICKLVDTLEDIHLKKSENDLIIIDSEISQLLGKITSLKNIYSKEHDTDSIEYDTNVKYNTDLEYYQTCINNLREKRRTIEYPKDRRKNRLTLFVSYLKKYHFKLEADGSKTFFFTRLIEATYQIIDIFESDVALKVSNVEEKNEDGKSYTKKIITLPGGLNEVYTFSNHLPRIVPPKDWNNKGYQEDESLVKFVQLGSSEIIFDTKTILAINRTQQKKFKINENFVNLLNKIYSTPSTDDIKNLKLPFFTRKQIEQQENKVSWLAEELDLDPHTREFIYTIINAEMKIHVNNNEKFSKGDIFKTLLENFGITTFEKEMKTLLIKEYKLLKIMKSQEQIFSTMLSMANVFLGFPLYFSTFVDYRGRMYPKMYLFSRTSGFYKYLLSDFKSIKLTKTGITQMLDAYFIVDETTHNKYKIFCKTVKTLKTEDYLLSLFNYFSENKTSDQQKIKNYLYFKLLEIEISLLKDNKFYTNFMIEIDQKASSSVFLSLILGNKTMSYYTNITSNKFQDIYIYLQSKTGEFLLNNNLKVPILEQLFINKRQMHKHATMCFGYSQEKYGRQQDFLRLARDMKDVDLNNNDISYIYSFALKYEEFLYYCFPKLKEQYQKFKECLTFFNINTHETEIRTLDGSVIKWSFYLLKEKTGSRYNPIADANQNYRRIIPYEVTNLAMSEIEAQIHEKKKI